MSPRANIVGLGFGLVKLFEFVEVTLRSELSEVWGVHRTAHAGGRIPGEFAITERKAAGKRESRVSDPHAYLSVMMNM